MLRYVAFSLCLFSAGFLPLQGAVSGYMKLGDIKGESKAAGHEDEMDVFEISWAINRSIPADSSGAQRSRGDTTLGDVVITRNLDKATPKLFEACSNGTFFSEAVLTFQKVVDGAQVDYLKITMSDVIVTSVSTGGSGGEDRLTENVSLNFTEAEVLYMAYRDDGTLEGNVPGTVQQSVGTP